MTDAPVQAAYEEHAGRDARSRVSISSSSLVRSGARTSTPNSTRPEVDVLLEVDAPPDDAELDALDELALVPPPLTL